MAAANPRPTRPTRNLRPLPRHWAEFGKPNLTVSTTSLTVNQNYDDTFGMAAGTQVRVADPVLLSLGFAYDTSAVSNENRTLAFNADDQYRWALGLQYDWSDSLTLGIAYEFLYLSSAPLSQTQPFAGGIVSGEFSTNHVNFVNFTLSTRF